MKGSPEGKAIVYCEGCFGTTNGKTAHGLVRRTERYAVLSVVDSRLAGRDARDVLDGKPGGIPIHGSLEEALKAAREAGGPATHVVIGLAPDGGRLGAADRQAVIEAIDAGLHVDSGLHDFLSEDSEIAALADARGVVIRDIRKPPARSALHFFSGKIEEVTAFRVAILGTDSAVGKRTTAWVLLDALACAGQRAVLVGTGQTAWLQGARYGVIFDSLVNDFVSGEIEHAVWSAWSHERPDTIILEGQGSLMNPAYPGGLEILAAARPHVVVVQHAPARKEYDGFPGYPLHPLTTQIRALELVSGRPVVAVTVNHENLDRSAIPSVCGGIQRETGLPVFDVLEDGAAGLADILESHRAALATSGERPTRSV